MHLKLKKISTKSFILIFSTINVIAGFILGAIVTIASLVAPEEQGAGMGVWAILLFPLLNGFLGALTGAFLTGLYNLLAPRLGGGLELEFESSQ
jgi:fluoride ion exporter CrcB/FEX